MNKVAIAAGALAVTVLAGCSKNEGEAQTELPHSTTAPIESKVVELSSQHMDKNVPLSKYVAFPADVDEIIFTKLLIAKQPDNFTDEEKLDLLSAEYYNERDAFKKKDIGSALLPGLKKELEGLASISYIAMPIEEEKFSLGSRTVFRINPPLVRSYNFDLGGFELSEQCWSVALYNSQNVSIRINSKSLPCLLVVKDEGKARAIEAAVRSYDLDMQGTAYVNLYTKDRSLRGEMVRAHIELVHKKTKEQLGSFDL